MNQTPRAVKLDISNPIRKMKNRTISTNAVTLAKHAHANKKPERITYLINWDFSCFLCKFWIKIIQESNAKVEIAMIHKSDLLSTITRNAPIQLVNQRRLIHRPIMVQTIQGSVFFSSGFHQHLVQNVPVFVFLQEIQTHEFCFVVFEDNSSLESDFWLFFIKEITVLTIQKLKIKVKIALRKFMDTAMVLLLMKRSPSRGNHDQPKTEKKKVIKQCHSSGKSGLNQSHQKIQPYSARTLGQYIYSWLASHAVE